MSKISSWVNILGIKKEFFSKFSNNADELFSGKKGYPFIYFNNTQKLEVGEFGETHYEMVQKVEKDFQSAQDTFEGGDWEDIPKYMQSHNAFYGRIDGAKRNIYFWLPGQKPFDSTSLLDCLFQLQQGNYVEKDPKIYFTDNPREYSVEGLSEITSSKVSWRIPDDFTSEKTDEYGSIIRLNDKGELHSLYSPAIEYASGSKAWYQNGRSHREDGPAKERANGDKYWYQNGTLHRTDGPAIEYADGGAFWYLNGKKHRENGPAIEWPDGNNTWYLNGDFIGRSSDGFTDEDFENYKREHNIITSSKVSWRIPDDFTSEETDPRGTLRRRNDKGQFHSLYGPAIEYPNGTKYWYQNGELHRTDGPAVEYADGSKSWYLNGDFLGRSNAGFTDEDFENYKREHNIITSSKVSWRIPDDFTSEETDNSGIIRRRNDKGQLHSLYSPAVEYPSGYKSWYQNGKPHRTDGPAVEYADGSKAWYQNGKIHRTDGPAIEWPDGNNTWCLNGALIGSSSGGFTDEDFENYKREHNIITPSKVSWQIPDDFTSEKTDSRGTLRRRNDKGQLHSLYSPALEYPSGYKAWYQNDKLHRIDGPAVEYSTKGCNDWYQNGKLHRTDGPAMEYADGSKIWYLNGVLIGRSENGFTDEDFENYKREHNIITSSKVSWRVYEDDFTSEKTDEDGTLIRRNDKGQLHSLYSPAIEWSNGDKGWYLKGKLHRTDGPAIELVKGDKAWYQNGKLHREDGPAEEYANGNKVWYLNGAIIGFSEDGFTDEAFEAFENYKREHNIITSSKVSWRIPDDFTSEETDPRGTLRRRNDKGQLHSLYSPAEEYASGNKYWYQSGKQHRTDGPAEEYANGSKAWYHNGRRHREDGPAMEWSDGDKFWYLNGDFIGSSENGFTDEDFENYKREHNITASKLSWRVYEDDFTSEETDNSGIIRRRNDKGQLHSLYSPAEEWPNGDKFWYQNDKLHRTDGPAEEYANGYNAWYQNGRRHREGGPALEYPSGYKYWYQNGKRHREDGPAIEYANGSKSWYLNGKLHRTDGPAEEWSNGNKEWYLNGDFLGRSNAGFTNEDFENYKREHNITASKLSWRVYEDDFASEETDGEGNLLRLDNKGQFHSLYSPALERVDGNKFWYRNNNLHRTDGPAVEYVDGDKSWYLNGVLIGRSENGFTDEDFENYKREHNIITSSKLSWRVYEDDFVSEETDEDGTLIRLNDKGQPHSLHSPAIEWPNGNKYWYQNGTLHRVDGPAIARANGDKYWYLNGKRHRTDGPAMKRTNGGKSWYLNGDFIGRSEDGFTDEAFENYKREHNIITSSKVSWRILDDFTSEETDGDGSIIRRNDKGQLHSLYSPAVEWPNGGKEWFQNGKIHRTDGPAVEHASGNKFWYQNSRRHREDGPAIEYADGDKSWYLNGINIGNSEDGFTDEDFENYKREHNIITSSKVSWRIPDDFTSEKTDANGTLRRRNNKGELHSLYSPAMEYANGDKIWYQNGKLHRTDGPTIEYADGSKFWFQNGELHRTDGPAIEWSDGDKSWYLNGEYIGSSNGGFTDEAFENYKREHNIITPSKVSWRVYEDDFTSEKTDGRGNLLRLNNKGQFHSLYSPAIERVNGDKYWYQNGDKHREDGPAEEYADGYNAWYQNGKLHREDGPAVERVDGTKFWYQNGKKHRTDGPAVEYPRGDKAWYLNGDFIGGSEDGFTDEDFENYKRGHNIITSSKFIELQDKIFNFA